MNEKAHLGWHDRQDELLNAIVRHIKSSPRARLVYFLRRHARRHGDRRPVSVAESVLQWLSVAASVAAIFLATTGERDAAGWLILVSRRA
jgi:hypothetical protein